MGRGAVIIVVLLAGGGGCSIDRAGNAELDGDTRRMDGGANDAGPLEDASAPADRDPIDTGPEEIDSGPPPAMLRTLRWELPCEAGTRSGIVCDTPRDADDMATFAGEDIEYDVTLLFRGVLEEKSHSGGDQDGLFNTGGDPADDPYTEAGIEVSDPSASYYLNDGTSGRGRAIRIDYMRTIRVRGGATVRAYGHTSNDATNFNHDDDTGEPIVIEGIPPAPAAFDGQFIQVDLISASPR